MIIIGGIGNGFDTSIMWGLGKSGGGLLGEIENSRFLSKTRNIFYIFMLTVMLRITLPSNSGSVECNT